MDANAPRPALVEIAPVVRSTAAELRVCARELQARVAMTVEDARKQRALLAELQETIRLLELRMNQGGETENTPSQSRQ